MTNLVHVSSKGEQSYTTPPELVQFLARRNGVDLILDLAASPENARCPAFISLEMDLAQPGGLDWAVELRKTELDLEMIPGSGGAWLNPEFKKAARFMERAALAAKAGAKIITLTLASLGTDWYDKWVKPNALSLILKERVRFVGQPDDYPKELMVSFFGFGMTGLGWLRWKEEAYRTYVAPGLPVPLFSIPLLAAFDPADDMSCAPAALRGDLFRAAVVDDMIRGQAIADGVEDPGPNWAVSMDYEDNPMPEGEE